MALSNHILGAFERPTRTSMPSHPLTAVAHLHGLLEVTRLVRTEVELDGLLAAIARTISESVGFGAVVLNLYRPECDDFVVTTVHGNEVARELAVGQTYSWSVWRAALQERFERRPGAYFLPFDDHDLFATDGVFVVPDMPVSNDPAAWHPSDALFVRMNHSDGHLLGILSVDEPTSGRRPTDPELDVLVALADHAALAIQGAQEAANAARHRAGLELLVEVSTRLTEALSIDRVLESVCDGIAALGFETVCVELVDERTGALERRATGGWPPPYAASSGLTPEEIEPLLDPAFERDGCFLMPADEAEARVAAQHLIYHSRRDGRGPRAWRDHWLHVPLTDPSGRLIGVIWVDDPVDRLLPPPERLQVLRAFANHAMAALHSAAHLEQMRFLADHDPLTRLLNRRALMERLEEETERARRYGRPFTLVIVDLDGFKAVNDRHGHLAGDAALRAVADALTGAVRTNDGAYRMGGDEFALILVEATQIQADEVIGRVRASLAGLEDPRFSGVGASFGCAGFPGEGATPEELLRWADQAMYAAKPGGRGR